MYVKNKLKSFSGLGHYYGQAETPNQEIKNAFPVSVGVDTQEVTQTVANPDDYIPTPTPKLNWMQARNFLRRPPGTAPKASPVAKIKGGVYWTATGPKFSQKDIAAGNKAESVPAPEVVWKPSITVVRDKPQIALPPIEMPTAATFEGLGEITTPVKVGGAVLCLIVAALLLYRRK